MILPDLGEGIHVVVEHGLILQDETGLGLCIPDLAQAVIILSGHHDVDIIIPGDKAMMTDGTKQRTRSKHEPQAMLFAHSLDFPQDSEFTQLQFAKRIAYIKDLDVSKSFCRTISL